MGNRMHKEIKRMGTGTKFKGTKRLERIRAFNTVCGICEKLIKSLFISQFSMNADQVPAIRNCLHSNGFVGLTCRYLLFSVTESQTSAQYIIFIIMEVQTRSWIGLDFVPMNEFALNREPFGNVTEIFFAEEISLLLWNYNGKR